MDKIKKEAFWIKLFGIKKGDIVRAKYGKVYWEVFASRPEHNLISVRRLRKKKYGRLLEYTSRIFRVGDIVEIRSKKTVKDTFPSDLY